MAPRLILNIAVATNRGPKTQDGRVRRHVDWVLPPLSNSWIMLMISLYIALSRTPNIDWYWVEAVPKM